MNEFVYFWVNILLFVLMNSNSQKQRVRLEQENLLTLQLDPEFNKTKCLFFNEVLEYIERNDPQRNAGRHIVLTKTKAYCNRFQKPGIQNEVLGKMFQQSFSAVTETKESLKQFEIACLVNLQPETAEEAKAIIPSLSRFEDCIVNHFIQIMMENINH